MSLYTSQLVRLKCFVHSELFFLEDKVFGFDCGPGEFYYNNNNNNNNNNNLAVHVM